MLAAEPLDAADQVAGSNMAAKRLGVHREEAAKLGANGVLLQGMGDQAGGSISTGFGQASASGNHAYGSGVGFSGNMTQKVGSGIAIYIAPN